MGTLYIDRKDILTGAEIDMQTLQFFRSEERSKGFLIKRANRWEVTERGIQDIIQRFENRHPAISSIIEGIIDELFELIRELRI